MPTYEDRRYNAEMARREADGIIKRQGYNPRTMPHIQALLDTADRYEQQNDREEMRRGGRGTRYEMEQGMFEMRYRENPGRYNPQDYPRNDYTQSEYEPSEMRRSSRTGRYIRSEYSPQMDYDRMESDYRSMPPRRPQPYLMDGQYNQPQSIIPFYPYYTSPYMHGGQEGMQEEHKGKIGFGSGGGKQYNNLMDEIKQYYQDYMRHKSAYEQSKDPQEKKHMEMELEELVEYLEEFIIKIMHKASTPEERQQLQHMLQNIQQTAKQLRMDKKNSGEQTF